LAGYLAIAPDALSPFGGTPATEDEGHAMFGKLDARQNFTNFIKALNYLKSRKDCTGKLGCVGFCWRLANQLAVYVPDLKATVAFYSRQPEPAQCA
jgi:carboxymethylenebutenolidase